MLTPGLMWTDDGQVIELDVFLKRIYSGISWREQKAANKEVHSQKENVQGQKGDFRGIAGPEVLTKNGRIRGKTLDKAHVFYGVPYAGQPTGAYRWKPPRAVSPWTGVYDATYARAACMQACAGLYSQECPKQLSEDCLYLNIFIPLDVNLSVPLWNPLPVLVWIHGGNFIAGHSSKPLYDGRFISNFTRTVVVSLDYRLGAFGFLVSGKDPLSSAVGNYGLMDQQAALLWVQRNIAVFGGDPGKVLFLCAKLLNPFRFLEVFETWGPCVDGELIKEQAVRAFRMGHWQKDKPVLLGTTSEEGVLFVYAVFNKPVSAVESTVYITAIFKQHTLRILHKYLPLFHDTDRRGMLAQVSHLVLQ
uniref:Carboxylesterase type B domain-containing protein n=1 Tax=Knipowitschia caucasica TaxID=637954 RepID=A0AAV2IZZ4_KNICA